MSTVQKKLIAIAAFAGFGWLYFIAFSSLETPGLLKSCLAVIPLQALALIYFAYGQWSHMRRSNSKMPNSTVENN